MNIIKGSEILSYINDHDTIIFISGLFVAFVAYVSNATEKYDPNYLLNHGFFGISFSVWVPTISSVYVILLIILVIINIFPKLCNIVRVVFKYIFKKR